MIKLSDFAKQQGVTARAVQKLFKKYKAELEGHYEEQGQNGTWIDAEAQELLRSHMKKNPVLIYDEKALPFYEELRKAQEENQVLREKLTAAFEKLSEAKDYQLHLQGELMEQRLLAARTVEAEAARSRADEARELAEKQAIEARKREIETEVALTKATEEKETLADIAEIAAQEAEKAKAEAEEARQRAEAAEAEAERLRARTLWQRIRNK